MANAYICKYQRILFILISLKDNELLKSLHWGSRTQRDDIKYMTTNNTMNERRDNLEASCLSPYETPKCDNIT